MNDDVCGDCHFACIHDPDDSEQRTCFGLPPRPTAITRQRRIPDPNNPELYMTTSGFEQIIVSLRGRVHVEDPACSIFVERSRHAAPRQLKQVVANPLRPAITPDGHS